MVHINCLFFFLFVWIFKDDFQKHLNLNLMQSKNDFNLNLKKMYELSLGLTKPKFLNFTASDPETQQKEKLLM